MDEMPSPSVKVSTLCRLLKLEEPQESLSQVCPESPPVPYKSKVIDKLCGDDVCVVG